MMDSADEESLKSSLEYTGAIGQLYHACKQIGLIRLSKRSWLILVQCTDALLMINSFGLQNALERSHLDVGHFFSSSRTSSTFQTEAVVADLAFPNRSQ
jgi:hypothetical protein